MSFVRTARGDVDPASLGFTYSHEHIVCIPPYWAERRDDDLLLDDPAKSKADVEIFRKAGGRTIVDATAIDYGRDVPAVARIGEETGVNIIFTAGFNKSFLWSARMPRGDGRSFADWIGGSSLDELIAFVVGEVEEGLEGTKFRAGQVKFGTGYNTITPREATRWSPSAKKDWWRSCARKPSRAMSPFARRRCTHRARHPRRRHTVRDVPPIA